MTKKKWYLAHAYGTKKNDRTVSAPLGWYFTHPKIQTKAHKPQAIWASYHRLEWTMARHT